MPDSERPRDSLLRDARATHRTSLPVLGVSTRFATDSVAVHDAVERTFGAWRSVGNHPDLLSSASVDVRVWMHEDSEGPTLPVPVRYRLPEPDRVLVHTPGSMGVSDPERGVVAYVTEELVADVGTFCESFLSALTLFAVTRHDRLPFHAACVRSGETALLLYGPGGTGKSTLALCCARAGLDVIGEDCVYIESGPPPRLWGYPGPMLVPVSSARFFDDGLTGHAEVVAGGRRKRVVEAPRRSGAPPVVGRAVVCLVERRDGAASAQRVGSAEIRDATTNPTEPGFDLVADRLDAALASITPGYGYRLLVGDDPHEAAALVGRLLETSERG